VATFALIDLARVSCPLMQLEGLEEAEAIARLLRHHHGRWIGVPPGLR